MPRAVGLLSKCRGEVAFFDGPRKGLCCCGEDFLSFTHCPAFTVKQSVTCYLPSLLRWTEHEKEERNLPKVRHYDSDEVRKYIARQRADRKKKSEEDEKARQEATTNRRRQLDELYRKQKETAKLPVAGGKCRADDRQGDMDRQRVSSLVRTTDRATWIDRG